MLLRCSPGRDYEQLKPNLTAFYTQAVLLNAPQLENAKSLTRQKSWAGAKISNSVAFQDYRPGSSLSY